VSGRHPHAVREGGDPLELVVGALGEQPAAAQQRDAVGESGFVHGWVAPVGLGDGCEEW